ncbi:uncharacterized protein F5891DRAFT_993602 [Suillus fuscotomentosus]|uniref:PPIase cyclophilin-type domain-containing protein n=1 Tax=Suillus fuscotomentosus TaxID=1912939 RepID=A0AAD4EPW0_9AGAM|nr:uncharacterized protein F5891DRAFT_993602 [Suillus fuscotomentosus]KAG1908539.1 hypothetical protein F5891DRAFT_993602 [Suillus fuscotomentosus]
MALPTNGRVIIDITAGEIEIELWSNETPRTCQNFIALEEARGRGMWGFGLRRRSSCSWFSTTRVISS